MKLSATFLLMIWAASANNHLAAAAATQDMRQNPMAARANTTEEPGVPAKPSEASIEEYIGVAGLYGDALLLGVTYSEGYRGGLMYLVNRKLIREDDLRRKITKANDQISGVVMSQYLIEIKSPGMTRDEVPSQKKDWIKALDDAELQKREFIAKILPLYRSLFTEDEVKELTAFFRSVLGQKFRKAWLPTIKAGSGYPTKTIDDIVRKHIDGD